MSMSMGLTTHMGWQKRNAAYLPAIPWSSTALSSRASNARVVLLTRGHPCPPRQKIFQPDGWGHFIFGLSEHPRGLGQCVTGEWKPPGLSGGGASGRKQEAIRVESRNCRLSVQDRVRSVVTGELGVKRNKDHHRVVVERIDGSGGLWAAKGCSDRAQPLACIKITPCISWNPKRMALHPPPGCITLSFLCQSEKNTQAFLSRWTTCPWHECVPPVIITIIQYTYCTISCYNTSW